MVCILTRLYSILDNGLLPLKMAFSLAYGRPENLATLLHVPKSAKSDRSDSARPTQKFNHVQRLHSRALRPVKVPLCQPQRRGIVEGAEQEAEEQRPSAFGGFCHVGRFVHRRRRQDQGAKGLLYSAASKADCGIARIGWFVDSLCQPSVRPRGADRAAVRGDGAASLEEKRSLQAPL